MDNLLQQMPKPKLYGTSRINLLSQKAVAVYEIEEAIRKLEGAFNMFLEAEPEASNSTSIALNKRVLTARISALSLIVSTLSEDEIVQTRNSPATPDYKLAENIRPSLDILAKTDFLENESLPAPGTRASFVPLSDAVDALASALLAGVHNLAKNSDVSGIDINKTGDGARSEHEHRDFSDIGGKRSQSPRPRMERPETNSIVRRPTPSNASATTTSGLTGVTDPDSTSPMTFPTSHVRTSVEMQVEDLKQSLVSSSPFSSQSISLASTHPGYENAGWTTLPYLCNTSAPYSPSSNISFIVGPIQASVAIPPKVKIFDRSAGSSSANSASVDANELLPGQGEKNSVRSSRDIFASIKQIPLTVPSPVVSATSKGRVSRTRVSVSPPQALDTPKGKARVSATKKKIPTIQNESNDGGKETSPRRSSRLNSSNSPYARPKSPN
ncbi:hypothetical protein JR316_0012300 [Psilocybe cubensis]|uniref:Uncharacterized protein n=2 Tax=Psilocybe cubensis TaxID=181762 RepID=A0ACB8GJE8_PSICU|nr:hypothetical protein JR316_0012300 [Psilocybe cubensis]KAH9475189.1 hypothetical protein JR316_0012300 [Psilocybe cubensis]